MPAVLIVGATRGLGKALVSSYASQPSFHVYATSRSGNPPSTRADNISWLTNIDLSKPSCGQDLASALKEVKVDTVIISAGYFATEDFGEAKWEEEVKMYTISSVAPVFIVQELVRSAIVGKGGKIILISSESGSITLRHEQEGGGNFAHHGSKAALNMVGKQLSFDLKGKDIAVAIVHPRSVFASRVSRDMRPRQRALPQTLDRLLLTVRLQFHAHRNDQGRRIRQVLGGRWRLAARRGSRDSRPLGRKGLLHRPNWHVLGTSGHQGHWELERRHGRGHGQRRARPAAVVRGGECAKLGRCIWKKQPYLDEIRPR